MDVQSLLSLYLRKSHGMDSHVTNASHLLILEPITSAWGEAQVRDQCLPLQLVRAGSALPAL